MGDVCPLLPSHILATLSRPAVRGRELVWKAQSRHTRPFSGSTALSSMWGRTTQCSQTSVFYHSMGSGAQLQGPWLVCGSVGSVSGRAVRKVTQH